MENDSVIKTTSKNFSVLIILNAFINKFHFAGFASIPNAYCPSDSALCALSIYASTRSREKNTHQKAIWNFPYSLFSLSLFCFLRQISMFLVCIGHAIQFECELSKNFVSFLFCDGKLLPTEIAYSMLFHLHKQLNKRIGIHLYFLFFLEQNKII